MRRKCRICGKYLTKNMGELGESNFVEEYKDGLCVKCWIEEHRNLIETAKVILCG